MATAKKKVNARKTITKKTRFEVFKRDSFKCQYCGEEAPNVVLNVDHIKPVAKGGTNHLTNLVTSCFSCNNGKRDNELSDDSVVAKQKKQLDELQERRQQLDMMMQWHEGLVDVKKDEVQVLIDHFNRLLGELPNGGGILNESGERFIRKARNKYPFEDVYKAIEIGIDQYVDKDRGEIYERVDECLKKLSGICKYMHADDFDKRKFYLRRVIDKRFYAMHPTTVQWFFDEMAKAKSAGVPLEQIETHIKTSGGIDHAIKGIASLTEEYLEAG